MVALQSAEEGRDERSTQSKRLRMKKSNENSCVSCNTNRSSPRLLSIWKSRVTTNASSCSRGRVYWDWTGLYHNLHNGHKLSQQCAYYRPAYCGLHLCCRCLRQQFPSNGRL